MHFQFKTNSLAPVADIGQNRTSGNCSRACGPNNESEPTRWWFRGRRRL